MTVDWEDNPARWVDRRTQFLASTSVGLRETVAEAVAWSELGYTASGIAKIMDVGETTARKYLDRADEAFPGILHRTVADFDGPEAGVGNLDPGESRKCPVCLKPAVVNADVVDRVFRVADWGATAKAESADLVCSFCHSVRRDGRWERMETVDSRAYRLAEASSSKSPSDYRDLLTRGTESGQQRTRRSTDAEDW